MYEEFFEKIKRDYEAGNIELESNTWYKSRVEDYVKTLCTNDAREKFLKALLRYLQKLEEDLGIQLPCIGLTYFHIAQCCLVNGQSYGTVRKYLKLSYEDDQKWEKIRIQNKKGHPRAKDMSAYRFCQILEAFLYYKRSNSKESFKVDIESSEVRQEVNKALAMVYNQSLKHPLEGKLTRKGFDKLLGNNEKMWLFTKGCYEGAHYLVSKNAEIHRKTNLAEYGIARGIITLCGATVEGVLSEMKYLNVNSNATLGRYLGEYVKKHNSKTYFIVLCLFLLSIRNQIHPTNAHNKKVDVDMLLARYTLRLTEKIMLQFVKSSNEEKI